MPIRDENLRNLLDNLGYTFDRVYWAVELLQGRVDVAGLRSIHPPANLPEQVCSGEEITETIAYESSVDIHKELRDGASFPRYDQGGH